LPPDIAFVPNTRKRSLLARVGLYEFKGDPQRFDRLIEGRARQGFEMLVDTFSSGILGGLLAIIGLLGASPVVTALSNALGSGVLALLDPWPVTGSL
jgi:hypothetical protein